MMKKLLAFLLAILLPVTALGDELSDFVNDVIESDREAVTEITFQTGSASMHQALKDLLNATTLMVHENDTNWGVEAQMNGGSAGRILLGTTEDAFLLASEYLGDRVLSVTGQEIEELLSTQMESPMASVEVEGFAFTSEQLADPAFMEQLSNEMTACVEDVVAQVMEQNITLYSEVEESDYYDPASVAFVAELNGAAIASFMELDSVVTLMTTLFGEEKAAENREQMIDMLQKSDILMELDVALDNQGSIVMLYLDASENGYDGNFTMTRFTQEGVPYFSWYGEIGALKADGSVTAENSLYGSYYEKDTEESFYTIIDSYEGDSTEPAEEITLIAGMMDNIYTFEIDFQKGGEVLGYGFSATQEMLTDNTRTTKLSFVELKNDKQTAYIVDGTTAWDENGVTNDWSLTLDGQALPALTIHAKTYAQDKGDFFEMLDGDYVQSPLSMTVAELNRLKNSIGMSAAAMLSTVRDILPASFVRLLDN